MRGTVLVAFSAGALLLALLVVAGVEVGVDALALQPLCGPCSSCCYWTRRRRRCDLGVLKWRGGAGRSPRYVEDEGDEEDRWDNEDEHEDEDESVEEPDEDDENNEDEGAHSDDYDDEDELYDLSEKKMSLAKAAKKLPNLAVSMSAKTVKGIVHTLQPKQVDLHEIAVGWKLEQTVTRAGRAPEHCVATIELRRDGTVRTRYRGEEMITDYTFRQHSWPRACTIEFDAYAFQGPHDPEPVLKHYKGEFSRNLMDSSIITMKGAIYDLQGRSLWKKKTKSGRFSARRRPVARSHRPGDGRRKRR